MKNLLKEISIKSLLVLTCVLLFANLAQAGSTINSDFKPINEPFDISNQLEGEDGAITGTNFLLQIIAGALLFFAAPIAVIMIVLNAFKMVAYSAETDKVGEAKTGLTWSVAGLLIIILSYSIVRAIISFSISAAQTGAEIGTN